MDVDDLGRQDPFEGGCLNYLHFGHSLAALSELLRGSELGSDAVEDDLVSRLRTPCGVTGRGVADAADVLRAFTGPCGRVPLCRLRHDVEMSLRWRKFFRSLGCRGFSFRFREDPHFRSSVFSSEVSLKVALITDRDLYYPPKVRHCLPAAEPLNRHISHAIGWLLIKEKSFEGQRWWYVINVQSDLMSVPVSCLKEIFRGWQRVLFRLVIGMACQRGVAALAIPSAELMADSGAVRLPSMLDAAAADASRRRDRAWRGIYDGVADFFAMSPTQDRYPTSIQSVWFAPPKSRSPYYVGRVSALIESFPGL